MRVYRLLTDEDTAVFCHRVSAALAGGWELHGSPAYAHDPASGKMRCAQAVVKDVEGDYSPDLKLGEL
ncbi:DUF1737 domain-containing protein [Rhodovulum sp. YEN HP10]|uniref:DUF1737 domain-containing protein n=1 Tax=Rhodovulum sp. HP10 TaxID=3387397 RepID=UPI0039DF2F4A